MAALTQEMRAARKAWIDKRIARYAAWLCPSFWHDEGHSVHSTCYTCGGTFMRRSVVASERARLRRFTMDAERYARDVGLIS